MTLLITLSPAKKIKSQQTPSSVLSHTTTPALWQQTLQLVEKCQAFSNKDLQTIMGVSESIASLNTKRYQDFPTHPNLLPTDACVFQFDGDVYKHFDPSTLADDRILHANMHIAILSGLYGLLSPLDRMHPYRLEMGLKIKPYWGFTLSDFWRDTVTRRMNSHCQHHNIKTHINLASSEYAQAINTHALCVPTIRIDFKTQKKDGSLRTIGVIAKRARGLMARHLMQSQVLNIDALLRFRGMGFAFDETRSKPSHYVFVQPHG